VNNDTSIRFSVKLPNYGSNGVFGKHLNSELVEAENKIIKRIQREVKTVHRFKNRTHNLQESTIAIKGLSDDKPLTELKIAVDLNKADYGKFIIKGFKSWEADPYLNNALNSSREYIHKVISEAVSRAVARLNKRK